MGFFKAATLRTHGIQIMPWLPAKEIMDIPSFIKRFKQALSTGLSAVFTGAQRGSALGSVGMNQGKEQRLLAEVDRRKERAQQSGVIASAFTMYERDLPYYDAWTKNCPDLVHPQVKVIKQTEKGATTSTSKFLRNQSQVKYHFKKNWVGTSLKLEDNQEKDKSTNQFSALSQRFTEYGFFAGRGDSTKVFVELGYFKRTNDSLQNGIIQRVNNSQTFALRSKLIQNNKSDLSLFVNYRVLNFVDAAKKNEPSLNSRMVYNDRFFNQLIQSTTVFETNSGSIPQQEFTYLRSSRRTRSLHLE